ARDVRVERQPRRLAFGKGPLPSDSELELRAEPLSEELRVLADGGVQSLLLEGGAALAQSFLREDLVDKVLLFVAPRIAGIGVAFAPEREIPVELGPPRAEPVGDDVLLTAYTHEP